MRLNRIFAGLLLLAYASLPGCVIVQVGVTNPIPGLTTVAIAPFFNQSSERAVDGRLFASAYYAELQKVPGFQVIPTDVAERAIVENGLQMNGPDDALKLARILNVDAVVVGSITDYTPYPPMRLAMTVSWYSPYPWEFEPGVQDDIYARRQFNAGDDAAEECEYPEHYGEEEGWERVKRVGRKARRKVHHAYDEVRGQSPDTVQPQPAPAVGDPDETDELSPPPSATAPTPLPANVSPAVVPTAPTPMTSSPDAQYDAEEEAMKQRWAARLFWAPAVAVRVTHHGYNSFMEKYDDFVDWVTCADDFDHIGKNPDAATRTPLNAGTPHYPGALPPAQYDPLKPIMSYTRLFDGADADLQATLRDYLEVRGDPRSGGWQGYLNRSEDFIRFTSHVMIVEMLTLHGGEGKRRIIFKHRKYK